MRNFIAKKQRRRLESAVSAHIRQLQFCRRQLRYMDRAIFEAGMDLFELESILATWLCRPAWALGGKVPLEIVRTVKGRAAVATALRRISHSCP